MAARFARRSRIPASFAMGFIPAITLRIYPPPRQTHPPVAYPPATLWLAARRATLRAALHLRRIHRNQSASVQRDGSCELINSYAVTEATSIPWVPGLRRHVVVAFDFHSPRPRIINPPGMIQAAARISCSPLMRFLALTALRTVCSLNNGGTGGGGNPSGRE